jgi:molybdopterin-biosynthesis enzyme MoeA-like protein
MSEPNFFALIIGSEILNQRRSDKHFNFLAATLAQKGYTLSGSFVIEDDPALIVRTIQFIASQKNPVLFSFGGIGSTPDDYTRKAAAIALRDGELVTHDEAKKIIIDTLGEARAYPYSVRMAELPKGATLLKNPVNNMPAFALDERYFFMPGFPEMSHPMVEKILDTLLPNTRMIYRHTLTAACKENLFIPLTETLPKEVEFSSLPKLHDTNWQVAISIASLDETLAFETFQKYVQLLEEKQISYQFIDA